MGQRGPKPLPANVHLLRGNPSKKGVNQLVDPVSPPVEIPGLPKHLLPEARKEWKRAGGELQMLGLIAKIDRAAFALYCQAWAWLVWHEQQLQRDIKLAAEKREAFERGEAEKAAAAEARGETYTPGTWTGGDGFMLPTPNGSVTYNPHWVAKNKAAEQVDKFLASFGMSPSSRGRVTPSNNTLPLPGMDPPPGGFSAL